MRKEAHAIAWALFCMKYLFVYLHALWKSRWISYAIYGILLICTISMPLCLSILEESTVYGMLKRNIYYTDGHAILVHNAKAGDEMYFLHLPEAMPVWVDNRLYLDRKPEFPLVFDENGYAVNKIYNKLLDNGDLRSFESNGLRLESLEDHVIDVENLRFGKSVWLVILLFSFMLQQIVGIVFAHREQKQLQQMVQIGASCRIALKIAVVHFYSIQFPVLCLSFMISTQIVRFFTNHFMTLKISQIAKVLTTGEWIVYHVDGQKIVGILLLFAITGIFSYLSVILKVNKSDLRFYNNHKIRHTKRSILPFLFRQTHYLWIYIIMLPVLIAAILLLRLHPTPDETNYYIPEYSISVFLQTRERVDTQQALQILDKIDGIADVRMDYDPLTIYLVDERTAIPHADGTMYKEWQEPGFRITIFPNPEVGENRISFQNGTEQEIIPVQVDCSYKRIVVPDENGNYTVEKYITYESGEIRELLAVGNYTYVVYITDVLSKEKAYERRAQEYITHPDAECFYAGMESNSLILYMHPDDYGKILKNKIVNGFHIKLCDPLKSYAIQKEIYTCFGDEAIHDMVNYALLYEVAYNRAVGMNLLYTTLAALLFLFFAVITTLSLIDYAASHRETLRLLHMQGASHRAIIAAFVQILLPPAILTCAAVWAIVTPVEREYYRLRGYTDALMEKMDLRMIDDPRYLLAALAVAAVFVVPAVVTVARELRRLERM